MELLEMKSSICGKCGVRGYEEALICCFMCQDAYEHRYCFNEASNIFKDNVKWACEDCLPSKANFTIKAVENITPPSIMRKKQNNESDIQAHSGGTLGIDLPGSPQSGGGSPSFGLQQNCNLHVQPVLDPIWKAKALPVAVGVEGASSSAQQWMRRRKKFKRPLDMDIKDDSVPVNDNVLTVYKESEQEKQIVVVNPNKRPRKMTKELRCSFKSLKTRSTPAQICNAIKDMNPAQKQAVREPGFESLLDWNITELPCKMAFWTLKNFNPVACTLMIGKKNVRITADDVHKYFGLPRDPLKVEVQRSVADTKLLNEFKSQFDMVQDANTREMKLEDLNKIKHDCIVKKLLACGEPNDWFKKNFIILFNSLVVESTHNGQLNPRVLDVIRDTSKVKDYDWCEYVLRVLITQAENWKRLADTTFFRGPILLLLIIYVDRMIIRNEESMRVYPIIKQWDTLKLRARENEEILLGGFGKGYIRGAPTEEAPTEPVNVHEGVSIGRKDTKRVVEETEDNNLLAFLDEYLAEGRELAQSIRIFLLKIKEIPTQLSSNSLLKKVNEALGKMLNIKIQPDSVESLNEEEGTETQQQLWAQAEKCLEEIDKTVKAREDYDHIPSFNLGIHTPDSPTSRAHTNIFTGVQQVDSLKRRCEHQEVELQKSTKKTEEAMTVAEEEASKTKAAKEVIRSLAAQIKDIAERLPPGSYEAETTKLAHLMNGWETNGVHLPEEHLSSSAVVQTQLNDVAKEPAYLNARDERTAARALKPSFSSMSEASVEYGVSQDGQTATRSKHPTTDTNNNSNVEAEWIEQYEPGVYIMQPTKIW